MIGQVRFPLRGHQATASLGDDGAVTCDDPAMRRILQCLLARHSLDYSPAHGPWGCRALAEFAQAVRGELILPPGDDEPGTIY